LPTGGHRAGRHLLPSCFGTGISCSVAAAEVDGHERPPDCRRLHDQIHPAAPASDRSARLDQRRPDSARAYRLEPHLPSGVAEVLPAVVGPGEGSSPAPGCARASPSPGRSEGLTNRAWLRRPHATTIPTTFSQNIPKLPSSSIRASSASECRSSYRSFRAPAGTRHRLTG
jgi:hypothetical protein